MRRLYEWCTSPRQIRKLLDPVLQNSLADRSDRLLLKDAKRILVIRLDHLGDAILTSSLFRELRRSSPEAKLTLLTNSEIFPLVEHCPYFDRIEVVPRFKARRFGEVRRLAEDMLWARQTLWPSQFDLAVVPRWENEEFREGFYAYVSGATWKVGFAGKPQSQTGLKDNAFDRFYTHLAPSGSPRHEVERNLELLSWIGGTVADRRTEVWIDAADRKFAEATLPMTTNGNRVRVAVVLGASSTSRRWPLERFAEAVQWMTQTLGWEVVLLGSRSEIELGRVVEPSGGSLVRNLIGATTIRQTIAVLETCDLYVGNDTGPMHMASAVGVPVVEITGHPANGSKVHERSTGRFRPFDVPYWIAQPPSGVDECRDFCIRSERGESHCVLAVTTEQVKDLIMRAAESCGFSAYNDR